MLELIRHLPDLMRFKNIFFKEDDFCLVNSCWLPMLGIRANGDLDVVVRKAKWDEWFPQALPDCKSKTPVFLGNNRVRVLCDESPYLKLGYCTSVDELIGSHTVNIEGVLCVRPRLYIDYKLRRLGLVEERIRSEPFFRVRSFFFSRPKGLARKFLKDYRDFEDLQRAFSKLEHRRRFSDKLTDLDWGVDLVEKKIRSEVSRESD